jgi:hypothetical protein
MLEQIYPLEEAKLRGYVGRPVYAVLNDGSYFGGYLSDIKDGQIYLTGSVPGQGTVSTNASKARSQLAGKAKQARTSAFGYPGYGYPGYGYGAGIVLPLFLLALLFAFPFGFFW